MKSVCYYYQNRGYAFLRGSCRLDRLGSRLAPSQECRSLPLRDWEVYDRETANRMRKDLIGITSRAYGRLTSIHRDLERFRRYPSTKRPPSVLFRLFASSIRRMTCGESRAKTRGYFMTLTVGSLKTRSTPHLRIGPTPAGILPYTMDQGR